MSQSGDSNYENDEVSNPICTSVAEPGPSVSQVRRSYSDPTNIDTMDIEGQVTSALEQRRTDMTASGEVELLATQIAPGIKERLTEGALKLMGGFRELLRV